MAVARGGLPRDNAINRASRTVIRSVVLKLDLPSDWKSFRFPKALDERLQELLNRQDESGKLSVREKREARALVELVDMLSLMKARAAAAQRSQSDG